MGKKRIVATEEEKKEGEEKSQVSSKLPKKKLTSGTLHVEATFNNTKAVFSDK